MLELLLVISAAFVLAAGVTIGMVSDSLLQENASRQAQTLLRLSTSLEGRLESGGADGFYQELIEAARRLSGRLLVVDTDGKVSFDTFDERCGTLLPLEEVLSVLSGESDADYGFHRIAEDGGGQTPALTEAGQAGEFWEGCFTSALRDETGRTVGVLISIVSIQETVLKIEQLRNRIALIFVIALIAVLTLAALLSGLITRPVRELSAGIERMGRGDYGQPVHVPGRGEMADLAAAFNEMSEKVHRLDESRSQFVSNASHELKTPLATIKILVESMLYEDEPDQEMNHEFLQDIDQEIDRLSEVVSDLLTLARIDSRKMTLQRGEMAFASVVQDSVKRLRPLAEKKHLEMDVSTDDPCIMVADAGKLTQVCYNLIGNAIKYTPENGRIGVALTRRGRDAVLEVSDTGIGISEEDLPHIFDRFYRVDKSRSREAENAGTGLGLSIVRQIVRLHAGTVTARSVPGEGSVFTVQLPVL